MESCYWTLQRRRKLVRKTRIGRLCIVERLNQLDFQEATIQLHKSSTQVDRKLVIWNAGLLIYNDLMNN